jgi:integrase
MIAHVFKHRRRVNGKVESARTYRGRFRIQGDAAIREVALDTSDKQAAEAKLAQIVKEHEREKAGIIAPKLQRETAVTPLTKHLEDFVNDLSALGRSPKYLYHIRARATHLLGACRWTFPSDISRDAFVTWRSKWRKSPKTVNEYLNALNALLNWMERQGRIPVNPLKGVPFADTRGKKQLKRAFTDEEFTKLLNVAGHQRSLYMTAAYTGLRLGELRTLVWADLHLDHARPHLSLRALTAKNRRAALIPLHAGLVAEIKKLKPTGAREADLVFAGCHHATAARRIIKDIAAAGLLRVDSLNRKLCFHSLRYTFATKLAHQGVAMRTAQELLRHSDPRLTANIYTDVTCLPTFEAVYAMDWHAHVPIAAKDTAGLIANADSRTQIGTQNLARDSHLETSSVINDSDLRVTQSAHSDATCQGNSPPDSVKTWRREGDSNPR